MLSSAPSLPLVPLLLNFNHLRGFACGGLPGREYSAAIVSPCTARTSPAVDCLVKLPVGLPPLPQPLLLPLLLLVGLPRGSSAALALAGRAAAAADARAVPPRCKAGEEGMLLAPAACIGPPLQHPTALGAASR